MTPVKRSLFLSLLCSLLFTNTSFGWSDEGHQIIARLAFHFLDNTTKQNIKNHLGGLSIEDAATWMDDVRDNSAYKYMAPWHYVDIEKGEDYQTTKDPNIIYALEKVMTELGNKKILSEEQIKTDMLVLIHLIGDLHQPLHVGYPSDKGGNSVLISFKGKNAKLHALWDGLIIKNEHITMQTCLDMYDKYSQEYIKEIKKGNVLDWMNQSRNYLSVVYSYKYDLVTETYEEKSTVVIKKQLLAASLRLASLLEKYFGTDKAQ